MTMWRALVPIKQGEEGKSRLSALMDREARLRLVDRMAAHVLGILQENKRIADITILSPRRPLKWGGAWRRDQGGGLNPELTDFLRENGAAPLLIIHADLPILMQDDLDKLLDAAEPSGIAIATDRAGLGTNALALAAGKIEFHFGRNSRSLHQRQYPEMPVIRRDGLMADLDTVEDADFLRECGYDL